MASDLMGVKRTYNGPTGPVSYYSLRALSEQRGIDLTRLPYSVRVATVQFQMRGITIIDQFEEQVEYWVDVASDYNSDFVAFPELFTLELLSIEKKKRAPTGAFDKIADSVTFTG